MGILDQLFSDGSYRTELPGVRGMDVRTPISVRGLNAAGDFIPGYGDVKAIGEAGQALTEGDLIAAGLLGTGAAIGLIPGAGDAIARPIMAAGRAAGNLTADAIGAYYDVKKGDLGSAIRAFAPSRPMQSLSAGAVGEQGLLSDPVAQRGDEILGLLGSGRASEVTDEMLDMGDPVLNARLNEYLFNNYDLPMDEASRMARAQEMGFDTDTYHGGESGIVSFDPDVSTGKDYDTGAWTTSDPYNANRYAGSRSEGRTVSPDDRGSVYPLLVNTSEYGVTNFRGRNWGDAPPHAFIRGGGPFQSIKDIREDWAAWPNSAEAVRAARDTGRSGLVIKDVVDIGTQFPHPDHLGLGSEVANTVVAIDPATLRSRFARFDPRLSHLRNLSAGIGAFGLLGAMDRDQLQQDTQNYLAGGI